MLNELAKEIHENAVNHGWWEKERSFGEIIALCHSELSEALEEYRNGNPDLYYKDIACLDGEIRKKEKPEGIGIELADCIIRILDYCGKEETDIGNVKPIFLSRFEIIVNMPLPEFIAEMHKQLSNAYSSIINKWGYLASTIYYIRNWCANKGIDIGEAVRIKHEYNKTRPYKHGGKVI